jgi:hypothetical protein
MVRMLTIVLPEVEVEQEQLAETGEELVVVAEADMVVWDYNIA